MSRSFKPRLYAGGLATALTAGLLVAGPASGSAAPTAAGAKPVSTAAARHADHVTAPVPVINWQPCRAATKYDCAVVKAPLDYDNPNGPTVQLDLTRFKARNQQAKLGTIFINPGGPGGSSTSFVPFMATLFNKSVTARYDIVGIDPRGVGQHSSMSCTTQQPMPAGIDTAFPVTRGEEQRAWAQTQWFRKACSDNPAPIVTHMSTADTARDMDLIRQAVGDSKLNYYGVSYGSYLGTSYASMFPNRVGHVVVDAVLDPVAWSTGTGRPPYEPFTARIKSGRGAYEAMMTGLAECDKAGKARCAFAGGAAAKWAKLTSRAKAGHLQFMGEHLAYADLIAGTLGPLYGNDYTDLMRALDQLYAENFEGRSDPAAARAAAELFARSAADAQNPFTVPAPGLRRVSDAFAGVACADTRNPRDLASWSQAARKQDKSYPGFALRWIWLGAPCAGWPGAAMDDAYLGPFGGKTANPVLVIGNLYDPATPYQGAQRVARLFDTGRLLTVRQWGHGALYNTCAQDAMARYFLDDKLPAAGATCRANAPLYPGS